MEEKHQPQASLAFPTPGTLLLFPTDFPASQIVCVRLRRGDGRWRGGGGVEGKRTWSRLQLWTTACLCFWQREASRHKERFVAAVKTRDAQRLENMSDTNERGDCGCGLGFQGEGGGRHFSSGSLRSYVLRFGFSLNNHNKMSQQVKRNPKQCFLQMRSPLKREFGQEYEGKSK